MSAQVQAEWGSLHSRPQSHSGQYCQPSRALQLWEPSAPQQLPQETSSTDCRARDVINVKFPVTERTPQPQQSLTDANVLRGATADYPALLMFGSEHLLAAAGPGSAAAAGAIRLRSRTLWALQDLMSEF